MSTNIEGYLANLKTLLNVAHTHYDLSGVDSVKQGVYGASPPVWPFVSIAAASVKNGDNRSLNGYERLVALELHGYAPTTDISGGTVTTAGLRLGHDIAKAIEAGFAALSLSTGEVYDLQCSITTIDGTEIGLSHRGAFVTVDVTFSYQSTGGY